MMEQNLGDVQDVLLGKINHICNRFGLNNIMAQLYTVLYLSARVLSLNDMAERLKISKASASINIRALERYGAVRRVWVKGSRRDYYEADSDIVKVIMDRIKSMAHNRLREVEDMINLSYQALDRLNPSNKEEKETIKLFKQRLDKVRGLQSKAQSLFKLYSSGLLGSLLNIKSHKNNKKEALVLK